MAKRDESRELLVELLKEAAQLEHCLLNTYLFTACSLKSTPAELGSLGGETNRRRAIQFERLRAWKRSLLLVAHEEMLHLHYVQCMLRALGEPPSFTLPERAAGSGNWRIPSWQARIGGDPVDEGGVEVPVERMSPGAARRFVVYESTDALQDGDPFSEKMTALDERLHEFEVEFRLESMLFDVKQGERKPAREKLTDLYASLTPMPDEGAPARAAMAAEVELPGVEELRFQSIADLYERGILPLYREAYDFGWVKYDNVDLGDELLDPEHAEEGFLPIGPIYREKNFERQEAAGQKAEEPPLRNYMDVERIVSAIVDEGEGVTGFERGAEGLLATVAELGGARGYLEALREASAEKKAGHVETEAEKKAAKTLKDCEFLRQSHLYRFAMVMTELQQEIELCEQVGLTFEPAREPVGAESVALKQMTEELPIQFNAVYLALVSWLSRIYEIRDWAADKPRRQAIEMIATWPMMSIAIRPLLELASFLPVAQEELFRVEPEALPTLPVHAQQLYQLYAGAERAEKTYERMDYLAVKALADVAAWARRQVDAVTAAEIDPATKTMMLTRLGEIGHLDEFEKQLPYRVHGGYSGLPPDIAFNNSEPDRDKFEENPTNLERVFDKSLVLRLRFAGRGLVQTATDPDPPTDEVGVTGTHMVHPADGERFLDRALIWQPGEDQGNAILRGPGAGMPSLGVDCVEVDLMAVTGAEGATATYMPSGILNSTGAVQTTGVQLNMVVSGLDELLSVSAAEIVGPDERIRMALLPKDGQWPFQNGYNHLVWRDGEPIDPFVLQVRAGEAGLGREIFNEGHTLLEMTPLQRQLSARGPWGFDGYQALPDWVLAALPEDERALLALPESKFADEFLGGRAELLEATLREALAGDGTPTQAWVDEVVSLGERMRSVSVPASTTKAWLGILLHYGHTVSGTLRQEGEANPILGALGSRAGVELALAEGDDREGADMRWLLAYTQGVMDTDGLSDLVYGELYVPLTVKPGSGPVTVQRRWLFPTAIKDQALAYVATLEIPSPGPGIGDFQSGFELGDAEADDRVPLEWKISFTASEPEALVKMLSEVASAAQQMTAALAGHFGPA
ncbi:MAG TPA: ferritin-like domain-containing protein [Solirubrobacterales bacterium]|jgi:hypothetical protein|nr:ferritin-like domain-containing protein [Solirubrobacterales bacterium]